MIKANRLFARIIYKHSLYFGRVNRLFFYIIIMLARRFLCRKQLWHASCNCAPVRHTQSANQHALDTINLETRLPAPINKEPRREPFAKNLFLGLFDHEFMYYPEPQTKERHQQFFEWLQPIEKYMSKSLKDPLNVKKDDVLSHLRDLGVFRAHVEERHLGLSLNQTELAKLIEVLSCFPWLGSYMVKNHIAPIQIISTLTSDEQKTKYLGKIATGELVPTVCFTEPEKYGLNINDTSTTAIISDCDTHWILNGEKSFVVNGHDSNLFVVFCHCGHPQAVGAARNSFSILLVERDFGGVVCKDIKNLVGLHGSPVCTVSFNNTKVPKENLLGEIKSGMDILIDSLAPGNRIVAPQAVGTLRSFAKLLTEHVLQRKHLNKNLYEYEGVKEVIGKIATSLYSMESMLYFTTGTIDTYENQDCMMEKAMLEMFCANECVMRVYEGLQVIGAQSYLREQPYIRILEDALSYTLFDCYNIDTSTYLALLGLQHMGKDLHKHIFRLRNPFNFPAHLLRWATGSENRLKLNIADHLHPSLAKTGITLERCIAKLQCTALMMLERHGSEICDRQMELRRIAEIATRTFALITVLSRASRAYCIGLKNCEQDRQMAGSFALLTIDRVTTLVDEINANSCDNGDQMNQIIADLMYKTKDYFAEHPLSRSY